MSTGFYIVWGSFFLFALTLKLIDMHDKRQEANTTE